MFIESANNPKIKLINSLKQKKRREKEGLFICEGDRLVKDGAEKSEPAFIVVSETYLRSNPAPKGSITIPDKLFAAISDTVTPQGILGVFRITKRDFDDFDFGLNTLALNGISDPGNLGTLIRTAEAAGFINILLDKKCADIYSPKAVRSTMSALFSQRLYFPENLPETLKELDGKGVKIYPLALTKDAESLFETPSSSPVCIVVGNEANGIDAEILNAGYRSTIIPMAGKIESLNAAAAGSIAMYHFFRA